jgi:hypothetical protein
MQPSGDKIKLMTLFIVAMILINWLLLAAWLVDPVFALWAIIVVFLWWFAALNRTPAWPPPNYRGLVYLLLILFFLSVAFVTGVREIYFIPFEILILWLIERRLRKASAV